MAALDDLNVFGLVRRRISAGKTHKSIAEELRRIFPRVRGLSCRSVRRFCEKHNLHATARMPDGALDVLVSYGMGKVGPTYGRRTMTGFLASEGFRVSQQRVGSSLRRVDPFNHSRRYCLTHRAINPVPYRAKYFGEKLHIDGNEKLINFGVSHICAIDGFSSKIVGFISLPVKNNAIIYEELYRNIILTYGLWDQLRFDKGKEWNLSIFINESISAHRYNTGKPPHMQTSSKQNHTIERLWVEVNKRINYPIKEVLVEMEHEGKICMDDPLHRFCCSWLTLRVSNVGAKLFVASWNAHPIPGGRKRAMRRGIPNRLMELDNRTRKVHPSLLPLASQAIELYPGTISEPCSYGVDPLESDAAKQAIRQESFFSRYSFETLFCEVSNGCGTSFVEALIFFIDVTYRLSRT